MKKRIAASMLAVSLLMAGSTQNVLALSATDKVSAGRAVINSTASEVVNTAARLHVSLSPEFQVRLKSQFSLKSSQEPAATTKPAKPDASKKPAPKKPSSRGNFGTVNVEKVIRVAVSLTGTPYKRSGETPDGFDCSGFTRYSFKAGAGIDLPHSSSEQAKYGSAVSKADLQPGDLVFFSTSGSGISHVGIFVGGDNFISATSSSGVKVSSLSDGYWGERYISARRLGN